MKKRGIFVTLSLTLCLVLSSGFGLPDAKQASAQEITSARQAKKLAKKEVKGATVIEVDKDHEDGSLVYEVQLSKGKKEYDLVYRAADSKLISYSWEIQSWSVKRGRGKIISKSKCKKLAKKKVSRGTIISIVRKRSDGIDLYKVKMRKGNKKYELKFHARTGKLLEYEWELMAKNHNTNTKKSPATTQSKPTTKPQPTETSKPTTKPQPTETPQPTTTGITLEAAKNIVLSDAGVSAADVVFTKAEKDKEDGIFVYEIEFYTADTEYEYEINASTGAIYKKEVETRNNGGSTGNTGNTGNTGENQTPQVAVSMEQAKAIAATDAGVSVTEVLFAEAKLELDDGIWVYDLKFYKDSLEYEYEIDATTGAILDVDKESIYD